MTMQPEEIRRILWDQILPHVERPVRYTGGELHAVRKHWESASVRMAFAFPDVYEVGMSHLGLQILYHVVNRQTKALMERVFAPWPDMERALCERGIPLHTLESFTPLSRFDIIGFTLQYELSYTNILAMLDLAGIPRRREQRGKDGPLLVGGGPCAFNPEPLADFFDLFVIGDGEEALVELLDLHATAHREGRSREELLAACAARPGFYVPGFYQPGDGPAGTGPVVPVHPAAPARVQKRVVRQLEEAAFPDRPIVPFMDVVHDRMMLEVLRGCTHGCRFCQAGILYRPVRERSVGTLLEQACALQASTGHDEFSLTSLSTADYTGLGELVSRLQETFAGRGVGISLPSLRTDSFSMEIARRVASVRRSGLTFAPEAGSQRLRDAINKGVTRDDLLSAAADAFGAGWSRIKLYFMIGLPGETEEDLRGIAELGRAVIQAGRQQAAREGRRGKIQVVISAASFVPKPFTPFQWCPQDTLDTLREKQGFLRTQIHTRHLEFHYHDAATSHLEAAFARGDRRLGAVVEAAVDRGCRFDGWEEWFSFSRWQDAFSDCGLDPAAFANRSFGKEEPFPWDHIDAGVRREYLWREYCRAGEETLTPDCRQGGCTGCGICPDLSCGMERERGEHGHLPD